MREMVLNHASVIARCRDDAAQILRDLAVGMALLVQEHCSHASLRTCQPIYTLKCDKDTTLFDAIQEVKRLGARDEYRFLLQLATKCPLLTELDEKVVQRFYSFEAVEFPGEEGEPLVFCAQRYAIAVSFPSADKWDRDELAVALAELLDSGETVEFDEEIDNLARSIHAQAILDRFRKQLTLKVSPKNIWDQKSDILPNLIFGIDTQRHLETLPDGLFLTVFKRLRELDDAVRTWQEIGGAAPPWSCKVTPESASVQNDERLREARRFRSHTGERELFFWHARFGSAGRIHLRFDPMNRTVEIGYIGQHLPL